MYGLQKLELYCSQYKKLKNFVSLSSNRNDSEKMQRKSNPPSSANSSRKQRTRKQKSSIFNQNYLHSVLMLIVCSMMSYWNPLHISIGALALSSSDSQMPSSHGSHPRSSKELTEKLLNLDLGYNVLNSEMLRQGIGFSLETLDKSPDVAESRMDSFNRHDYGGDDWEEDFHVDDEEDVEESLPIPQHLSKFSLD